MFGPANNFILQIFFQVVEIITISRYANDQITIVLRIFLRLSQRIRRHHVELYVMTVEVEISTNQRSDLRDSRIIGKKSDENFWFSRVPPVLK